MTKAELGSGTPLTLRIDPKNTVSDAELAEYIFKETGISPEWYPCKLEKAKKAISTQSPLHDLQPQFLQPDQS